MRSKGTTPETKEQPFLSPEEPPPFRVLNPDANESLILLCDHASRRIPKSLGDLGLDPAALRCHLAWDIGAAALTERIAESLGVTAVLAAYSRLVVDCNRQLLDPQAFLEYGDGLVIPDNRVLKAAQREARAAAVYWPYHDAVAGQIARLRTAGQSPAVLAIHSFTPVLNGQSRPWEIGILWDKDSRVSDVLLTALRDDGYVVGDNEPYSGRAPQDFTIDHHAESAGLPHAGIEVRQDLIDNPDGVEALAKSFISVFAQLPHSLRQAERPPATA